MLKILLKKPQVIHEFLIILHPGSFKSGHFSPGDISVIFL
jgi:hypothetical protein